ncbi:hypothetical protein NKG05_19230 [Oerskovia sp. M15]
MAEAAASGRGILYVLGIAAPQTPDPPARGARARRADPRHRTRTHVASDGFPPPAGCHGRRGGGRRPRRGRARPGRAPRGACPALGLRRVPAPGARTLGVSAYAALQALARLTAQRPAPRRRSASDPT